MDINANIVRELREKTGAGVMDCKKALAEASGDLDKAIVWLRERGIAQAAKRAGKLASEGSVGSYIHAGGKLGVLVEVNCESDFVAKTPEFQTLVKEIAMQIAAANPHASAARTCPPRLSSRSVRSTPRSRRTSPKPWSRRSWKGELEKFYRDICLNEQAWVRDPNRTITDLLGEYVAELSKDRNPPLRPLPARRIARRQHGRQHMVREEENRARGRQEAMSEAAGSAAHKPRFHRVMLKLSGQALAPAQAPGSISIRSPRSPVKSKT